MKRSFLLFWHGLTGILSGIANWFTVILGMKDDSKYGRFIRRVVGTCFAIFAVIVTVALIYQFVNTLCFKLGIGQDTYCTIDNDYQFISRNVRYCHDEYGQNGYVVDRSGKKTLTHIDWIAKPLGNDTLICYSDGKRRGYFNMFTGKADIEPTYAHAWVFSEGLAAVEDKGTIKFIDQTGKVVIDKQLTYINGADGYVFHDGYCIVHNDRRDLFGLIDHEGNWVLQPKYMSIENADSMWIVGNGEQEAVLDSKMHEVLPFTDADYELSADGFLATMPDHTLRQYSRQGELLEDFYIQDVDRMTYETNELRYDKQLVYDEEGNVTGEMDSDEPTYLENVAGNLRYEAESGWYGLMSPDGKVITPPTYTQIKAIAHDVYLCKNSSGVGVILNGKGEPVK